jgi:hypothetical protein
MDKDLVQDYLEKSGMKGAQAESLSRIFAQMATKDDLLVLEHKLEKKMESLKVEMSSLRADMSALKADLTWRMVTAIAFLAALITILDLFVN